MNSTDLKYAERVTCSLQLLSGRWTVPILFALCNHPVRLSALRRANPGASKKALTASLRSLEASQIIVRRDLSKTVLHVDTNWLKGPRVRLGPNSWEMLG